MGFFKNAKQEAMKKRGYNIETREKRVLIGRTPYLRIYMPIKWDSAYSWDSADQSPIPIADEKTIAIKNYKKLIEPLFEKLYNGREITTYASFYRADVHKNYQTIVLLSPLGYIVTALPTSQAVKVPQIGNIKIRGTIAAIYNNTNPEGMYSFSVCNFSWSER